MILLREARKDDVGGTKAQDLALFLRDKKTRELMAKVGYNANGPISPEDLADMEVGAGRGEVWMLPNLAPRPW